MPQQQPLLPVDIRRTPGHTSPGSKETEGSAIWEKLAEVEAKRYQAVGDLLLSSHKEFAEMLGCGTPLNCTVAFHSYARDRLASASTPAS